MLIRRSERYRSFPFRVDEFRWLKKTETISNRMNREGVQPVTRECQLVQRSLRTISTPYWRQSTECGMFVILLGTRADRSRAKNFDGSWTAERLAQALTCAARIGKIGAKLQRSFQNWAYCQTEFQSLRPVSLPIPAIKSGDRSRKRLSGR